LRLFLEIASIPDDPAGVPGLLTATVVMNASQARSHGRIFPSGSRVGPDLELLSQPMNRYIDILTDTSFAFGGTGVLVVALLALCAWILMPGVERRKVHAPAILLATHVAFYFAHRHTHSHAWKRALELGGLLVLLLCFGRILFILIVEWFFRFRLKRPLPRIVADIIQGLIYLGVAFIVFRELGAEVGSLLTTSALITAVIGLSLQETLGNLFAGLAIQAQRPFEVGDWIQIEDSQESATGKVIEINWRATKLLTNDRVEIIIPNALLAKSPLRNYSQPSPATRRRITVQAPYHVAPHIVEAALAQAATGCTGVIAEPAPDIWVSQYADNGVEYTLLFYIADFERRAWIDAEVRRRIWYTFQRAGIEIPYPIHDVRIQQAREKPAPKTSNEQAQERLRMMRSVDFLDALPAEALEYLANSSRYCLYDAGEDIVRQGEQGTELFIIRNGSATVLFQGDNQWMEVARVGPGGVFGEMSLVTGEGRSATVRACSACEVLIIGHQAFGTVLERNPELAKRVSEVLAKRQAEIEQVQSTSHRGEESRESVELLDKILSFFSLRPRGD
jgi:small-conductance mechanosensitive channel/CRP-like cAMP-binding protein